METTNLINNTSEVLKSGTEIQSETKAEAPLCPGCKSPIICEEQLTKEGIYTCKKCGKKVDFSSAIRNRVHRHHGFFGPPPKPVCPNCKKELPQPERSNWPPKEPLKTCPFCSKDLPQPLFPKFSPPPIACKKCGENIILDPKEIEENMRLRWEGKEPIEKKCPKCGDVLQRPFWSHGPHGFGPHGWGPHGFGGQLFPHNGPHDAHLGPHSPHGHHGHHGLHGWGHWGSNPYFNPYSGFGYGHFNPWSFWLSNYIPYGQGQAKQNASQRQNEINCSENSIQNHANSGEQSNFYAYDDYGNYGDYYGYGNYGQGESQK